jgi:type I restriction enzyme, R subunit
MEVPYYISILYLARFVAEALVAFIETFPESLTCSQAHADCPRDDAATLGFPSLRKLLNNEIKVRSKKFLIQSRSFAELLEETLRKYRNRAIETAQVVEELIALAKKIREAGHRG